VPPTRPVARSPASSGRRSARAPPSSCRRTSGPGPKRWPTGRWSWSPAPTRRPAPRWRPGTGRRPGPARPGRGRSPTPPMWPASPERPRGGGGALLRPAPREVRRPVWRDAALGAGRDLRVELRSRVTLNQVAPFAVVVLLLFAFALDPDRGLLERATAGLYWVAVLLSALLAIGRSAALDESDGARDALRLSGLEPGGVFLGKTAAVTVQLLVLEVLLGADVVVLYGADPAGIALPVATCVSATVGVAATGTLYG